MQYNLAATGGTFDHFHKGHKELIRFGLEKAKKLIIGVTDEALILDKDLLFNIENYGQRARSVEAYVSSLGRNNDCEIVVLSDRFGPTRGEKEVDCLVCSPLTEDGAKSINLARKETSLESLPIEICQMQTADDGEYISSTRIRRGEINREGLVYRHIFNQNITISDEIRQICKNPLGSLINKPELNDINFYLNRNGFNIVVGDYSGSYFWDNKIKIRTIIFDGKNMRQEFASELLNIDSFNIINEPGGISHELAGKVEEAFWANRNIKVEGEEDLAVIPAILLLPLGTKIFYGQPNQGLVVVTVSEELKNYWLELIKENRVSLN